LAQRQGDLLDDVVRYCDQVLRPDSVYSLLHHERDRLFPDEFFADLFSERGRRSGPPFGAAVWGRRSVVATVMVLQSLEARTVPAEHSLRLSLIGRLLGANPPEPLRGVLAQV